jgi:two-component system, cell cycle response regulator
MEFNNVFKKMPHNDTPSQLSVWPVGFDTAVVERIKNILNMPRQTGSSYHMAANAMGKIDVLLVNYDNSNALLECNRLLSNHCPKAKVVALSQGPLTNPPLHHIRGMLTASRLLTVLDKLPTPAPVLAPVKPLHSPHIQQPEFKKPEQQAPKALFPQPTVVPISPPPPSLVSDKTGQETYRALIVDDSMAIQMSIKLKLQTIAQITQIDFAINGESALAKAAATHYDLIFLDVMMPGIDGYETCTRLRKKPEYKKTPIIMVTGKTSPLDEVKGVMAGCTTYLTKPVEDKAFQKLSQRVLSWLSERKITT